MSAQIGAWELDSVVHTDALSLLRGLPDGCVDLIATDPPFNIGKAAWDSWDTLDSYLAWLDDHLREFKRVLKPNGSLYLFAATRFQARVELAVGSHFNVLSNIRWRKPFSRHNQADKETLRAYWDASESIVFGEMFGADNNADELSGFSEAELSLKRQIWGAEIQRAMSATGVNARDLTEAIGAFNRVNHGGAVSNWLLGMNVPTSEQYHAMRVFFCKHGGEYLRREHEDLRREYEDLRRPFYATADAPYTDVWDFATVNTYPGKHVCEKPLDMCQHIVRVSSRPGALVLDPFCGSGNMLRAAFVEGRRYLGGDSDGYWARRAADWIPLPFDVPLFAAVQS